MLLFGDRNPETAYPSDHRHVDDPAEKQRAVAHYEQLAAAAAEDMPWTFEAQLGHAMLRGEIDASAAMVALDDYERWLEAGEPKMTTLDGPFIFK